MRLLRSYGLIGIFNTVLGFSVIAGLTLAGISPVVSNVCGYAVGLLSSFGLNAAYTFRNEHWRSTIVPFLLSVAICYALNMVVLLATQDVACLHTLIPQILAVAAYNVAFFLLMKFFVFSDRSQGTRAMKELGP